ncbi:MAG TPA: RiPP maturation radical SAM C-methyltransferase [Myxococcales bacterium]|nr:RiPP maturation radical SAM C-methyltransferase [Myxococcales bacterium]
MPPFAGLDRAALGPHLLQACARRRGFDVHVYYANVRFAARIGEDHYQRICYGPTTGLAGERVFARAAFDLPPLGRMSDDYAAYFKRNDPGLEELRGIEASVDGWLDGVAEEILALRPAVVGCSTTFEQTCASFAILRRVKQRDPGVVTLLGGSNCDGEMGQGLAALGGPVDHVFSGECETAFPDFLGHLFAGGGQPAQKAERVISATPCDDLDALPRTDLDEFYAQLAEHLPGSTFHSEESLWLPYESSRGCWWGQKHHCTFCGINGQTMKFREKSAGRVLEDVAHLVARHRSTRVCMVDNIMPYTYFRTLIPALERELPGLHIFYEQKANLTLENVLALRRAGVAVIQPGIEALSTELLRLMRKGVTAAQNVALLRYCRMTGMAVNWNLLYGFPADREDWYTRTHDLAPLLHHLPPPAGAYRLSLDRFSPYHSAPEAHGIQGLEPLGVYRDVFPEGAPIPSIAYHFEGEMQSESRGDTRSAEALRDTVRRWRSAWEGEAPPPVLEVTPLVEGSYLLTDTRPLPGGAPFQVIDREQARAALTGDCGDERVRSWAVEARVAVILDGKLTPLATSEPELLQDMAASPRAQGVRAPAVEAAQAGQRPP